MLLLPDWAPNIHPLLVHFPIALLVAAAIVDSVGMVLKNQDIWRQGAMGLYVGGALGTFAAWLAGKQAADSVFLPTDANALLTEHSDLGHYLFYFFTTYAVIRVTMYALKLDTRTLFRTLGYFTGLGGIVLLWATADHGAQLVYVYGVGVKAVPQEMVMLPAPNSDGSSSPVSNEDGGWTFKPTRASSWLASMTMYGAVEDLQTSMKDGGERGDVLALSTSGRPVMFTFDQAMVTVQIDLAMNLDDFVGTVMIVHHVIDENNYHFTSASNEEMKQGRSENGDIYLMDNKPYSPSGWHSYRVVADQTHFRSYSDQALTVHGHGDDPGSGWVGIRLNGTGTMLLDYMQTVSLRGEGKMDMADHDEGEMEMDDHDDGEDADHEH